jgi:hypothetical protein
VVLVDDVERSGGAVVKVLALYFSVDSQNPTLATMLGASAEIVAFLRCDVPAPEPLAQVNLNAMACGDLKSR